METTNRTRAEIQAEIEKLQERLDAIPDIASLAQTLMFESMECIRRDCDDGPNCRSRRAKLELIEAAADLIPRAEHEAAVEEARSPMTTKALLETLVDPVAYHGGKATHYHTALRNYGQYRVTVERVDADKPAPADAKPIGYANRMSDGAWSGIYESKGTARSVAEYGGWAEVAVPLYRHPAPNGIAVALKGVVDNG